MTVTDTDAYIIEPERKSKHYKWWFVALGVIITLLGIACLVWPRIALIAVAIMAGIGFIASGISGIATYFDMHGFVRAMSGWSLVGSIVDVLLGVMFLMNPLIGGVTVAWIVGILVIAGAIMDGVACWRARDLTGNGACALGIISAVLMGIFGILMLAMPSLFSIYLGCMLIVRGITLIIASFGVSSLIKRYLN